MNVTQCPQCKGNLYHDLESSTCIRCGYSIKRDNRSVRISNQGTFNPAVWTGQRMAHWFETELEENQVQPNGIDLRIDRIFEQKIGPSLTKEKEYIDWGQIVEQLPDNLAGIPGEEGFYLQHSAYIVEWMEIVKIPPSVIGLVFPRSTLLRMGATINGAVWDGGYHGKGKSLILKGMAPMLIERGARLAQMIFIDRQEGATYEGTYQNEGLEKDKAKD